nr:MAG TPA: hypothetical protein [Caudoviricetes sp.]
MAAKMLQHPDVFARADDESAVPAYSLKQAEPAAPSAPAAPAGGSGESEALLGSDVLPAHIEIGDHKVQLGTVVAAAHARSGLTVIEWNALKQEEREQLLADEITAMTAELENPPEFVIQVNGARKVLDGMEKDDLVALAAELKVDHHHAAGARNICGKLVAAYPVE